VAADSALTVWNEIAPLTGREIAVLGEQRVANEWPQSRVESRVAARAASEAALLREVGRVFGSGSSVVTSFPCLGIAEITMPGWNGSVLVHADGGTAHLATYPDGAGRSPGDALAIWDRLDALGLSSPSALTWAEVYENRRRALRGEPSHRAASA